jgi:hypothetical protein
LFVKALDENKPQQFQTDAAPANRLLEKEFFDILPGKTFFQQLPFKTAFASTVKTIKQMISGNKIESYSQRRETACKTPLCPPQRSKLANEEEEIIASLDKLNVKID